MSERSSSVTARHFQYIAAHTKTEDGFLKRMKQAAQTLGIPPIWIAPEQAVFIQVLLKSMGARRVLEVGTLAGYSAIMMARALPPGGRVLTIEINPRWADFAREWIARSDVSDRVDVLTGSGRTVLPKLVNQSVDAAFLDADKTNYPFYLKECLRILRPAGLILADNAFAFGELFSKRPRDREVPAVRAFNEVMAKTKGLQSVIVPLGDGLWVGVKQ